MQIKYVNGTLKLDSTLIASLFTDEVLSITVKGNINCCKTNGVPTESSKVLELVLPKKWVIDFTIPVKLGTDLLTFNLYNTVSGLTYDIINSNFISLGGILGDCVTETCTMQSVGGYDGLFKTLIDDWFATNAISSNCTVTISGNVVSIGNLPTNFLAVSVTYGSLDDPDTLVATYIVSDNKEIYLAGNSLYVTHNFFGIDALTDGVYKIELTVLYPDGSHTTESNCTFVDILTKCIVATWLNDLLAESSKKDNEPVATMIHILHYALVTGSNCGCNCDSLCEAYKELTCLLNGSKTTTSCGC